jgi:hypothetical protein
LESDTISQYQSFIKGLNKGKKGEGKECIEISQSPQSHKQAPSPSAFFGLLHAWDCNKGILPFFLLCAVGAFEN